MVVKDQIELWLMVYLSVVVWAVVSLVLLELDAVHNAALNVILGQVVLIIVDARVNGLYPPHYGLLLEYRSLFLDGSFS